ncbi:hypothetical protein [Criblamydia sequanensis]|uniref:Uncharacterized protein n=1 Tax=Candidatus Criblamydia sequanensis CRIB-18 TaxID=1437425 RepID=A0A090CY71_9BACT|nr:hypothetical protein [Criblamydia sequanensis]CDR33352.1 hypothetical protein CSEC_0517 [Criblamydia sequanensis CRIB-18]
MGSSDLMGYLTPRVHESFSELTTFNFDLLLEKKEFRKRLKKDFKNPEARKNGLYQQNLRIEALINAFVIEGKDKYLEFATELHDNFIRNKFTVNVVNNQETRLARAKKIQKSIFNSFWELQFQTVNAFMQIEAFKYDLSLHQISPVFYPTDEGKRAFDRALENYVFIDEIDPVLRYWKEYSSFEFGFLKAETAELIKKGKEESDFLILLETQTLKERVKEFMDGDKKMVALHQLNKRILALIEAALFLRNNSFLLAGLELRDFAFGLVKNKGSLKLNSENEDINKGLESALACLNDLSFIYSNKKIEACNLDLSSTLQEALKELVEDTAFTANFREKNKERLFFLEGPRTFSNISHHLGIAKKLKAELNNHTKMQAERSRKASLVDEMKFSRERELSSRNEFQKDEPSPRNDSPRESLKKDSTPGEKELKKVALSSIDSSEFDEAASKDSKYQKRAHQQVKAFQKARLKKEELIAFYIKKLTEDNYLKENFSTATGLFFQAPSTVEEVLKELQSDSPANALKILTTLKRKIPEIFFHK